MDESDSMLSSMFVLVLRTPPDTLGATLSLDLGFYLEGPQVTAPRVINTRELSGVFPD